MSNRVLRENRAAVNEWIGVDLEGVSTGDFVQDLLSIIRHGLKPGAAAPGSFALAAGFGGVEVNAVTLASSGGRARLHGADEVRVFGRDGRHDAFRLGRVRGREGVELARAADAVLARQDLRELRFLGRSRGRRSLRERAVGMIHHDRHVIVVAGDAIEVLVGFLCPVVERNSD